MASFSHEFLTAMSPGGVGSTYFHAWNSVYPPELGCVFSPPLPHPLPSFGGGGVFGPPSSTLIPELATPPSLTAGPLLVVSRVTNRAREIMARGLIDGTSLRVVQAGVGTGGFDNSNPTSSLPIDPTATSLQNEIFRDVIDRIEIPVTSGTAVSFVFRISRTESFGPIGEIALYAEIQNSPIPLENGSLIMFSIAHQPIITKTPNHVYTTRIIIAF